MKNLNKRTSIRKYAPREVSDELLYRLLREAERTQTMGNLQLYSVVITRSEKQKEALAPAHFNQPMVKGAPVVLTFCADFRRTSRWAEERNAKPGYDNFLSFINAATDALLYCQTFCNLADEEGLGYGVGTSEYERPYLTADNNEVLKTGMVIALDVKTLGYKDELIHSVDIYELTHDGNRRLSDFRDWNTLYRINGFRSAQ